MSLFFHRRSRNMTSSSSSSSTFLHPASGALILGLDWLLFSGSVITLGLSTGVLSLMGLVGGAIGVAWIQHRYAGDTQWASVLKGGVGGIVIGLPLPIAGTVAGGAVLAMSGLNELKTLPWSSSDDSSTSLDGDSSSR